MSRFGTVAADVWPVIESLIALAADKRMEASNALTEVNRLIDGGKADAPVATTDLPHLGGPPVKLAAGGFVRLNRADVENRGGQVSHAAS